MAVLPALFYLERANLSLRRFNRCPKRSAVQVVKSALYKFIAYAEAQGVRRIEWVVLDWNTHAVNFYENSGADVLEDWRTVQMDQAAMRRYLAKENENI